MNVTKYVIYKYNKKNAINHYDWNLENTICSINKNVFCGFELFKKKLLFSIVTRRKYRICYIKTLSGELIHYSFIIPYCSKFSFMEKDALLLGPCWTKEEYRGNGIYGKVLDYIAQKFIAANPNIELYALVRKMNVAQQKELIKQTIFPSVK